MIRYERNGRVDQQGHELREHGTALFPAGLYDCEWSWEAPSEWHWHEELEAVFVTEGDALAANGSSRMMLHPGDGFFVNSGAVHNVWLADRNQRRLKTRAIVFHPRLIGGSPGSVFWETYISAFLACPDAIIVPLRQEEEWEAEALACLKNAWESAQKEPYGFEFEIRAQLSRFFVLLSKRFQDVGRGASKRDLLCEERIKLMLRFVHAHYAEPITVSDIAEAAAVSDRECLRCFRRSIGTPPSHYLRQYRVHAAVRMLSSTDESVSNIAAKCGFQDMSYFSKSFREIRGCSPTEYRKTVAAARQC